MNEATIQRIKDESEAAVAKLEARDVRPFHVTAVEFDGTDLSHDDTLFNEDAKKQFLDLMHVKPDFPELGQQVDRTSWESAVETIKKACGELQMYALHGEVPGGGEEVVAVYKRQPSVDNVVRHRQVVSMVTGALMDSPKEWTLNEFSPDPSRGGLEMTLTEHRDLTVGPDDDWRWGVRAVFNDLEFACRPYFLRLACENGMIAEKHAFVSTVDKRKHSIAKIAAAVRRFIVDGDEEVERFAVAQAGVLRAHNASVAEYQWVRNALKRVLRDEPELFETVDSRYFDDSHIRAAYGGVLLEDQTRRWLMSADSGVLAYDLFNLMTWIGSHPGKSGVGVANRDAIQTQASRLLFKSPLDLTDVPPRVNVPRHRIDEMA